MYELNSDFIVQSIGDASVIIRIIENESPIIFKLNESASLVVEHLSQKRSKEYLISLMMNEYQTTKNEAVEAVDYVLNTLQSFGALTIV